MADKKNEASITKQDAVRRAVATLGKSASAKDIQKHIKETFGHDMTVEHIYNAKSTVLAKAKKKRAKKPAATEPAVEKPAVQPAVPSQTRKVTGGISLEDIQAAKALVQKIGPEQLQRLIALLAK
jgi:hypothetical protein